MGGMLRVAGDWWFDQEAFMVCKMHPGRLWVHYCCCAQDIKQKKHCVSKVLWLWGEKTSCTNWLSQNVEVFSCLYWMGQYADQTGKHGELKTGVELRSTGGRVALYVGVLPTRVLAQTDHCLKKKNVWSEFRVILSVSFKIAFKWPGPAIELPPLWTRSGAILWTLKMQVRMWVISQIAWRSGPK